MASKAATLVNTCQARKADGTPCQGKAKKGEYYCTFHRNKLRQDMEKRRSQAEVYGIEPDGQEAFTFEQFHSLHKPFELYSELAYLRTILTQIRRQYELSRVNKREEVLNDLSGAIAARFADAGMQPRVASALLEAMSEIHETVLDHHYGSTSAWTPGEFMVLADMIEKVSRVAEKAKKIQEGITLVVDFKNVGPYLTRFVRDVVFPEVDSKQRKAIVQRVRDMNLLGSQQQAALPPPEDIVEADYTLEAEEE